MSQVRRRDSGPELRLRSDLHRRGLRFRVDVPLPGMRRRRADILFKSAKVAVLVDGCFWHGCPQHGVLPNANREWWQQKLQENRARDAETDRFLEAQGFLVFRVWEHEDPAVIAEGIEKAVRRRWHRLQVSDTRRADAE